MLKPIDIHNKEFKRVMRGYDIEQVDEFLDEIIVDYEKLYREIDSLREQLNSYHKNVNLYKERENALNNALIMAQQMAENIKFEAEKEAHKTLKEAEEQSKKILGQSELKLKVLSQDYQDLNERVNTYRNNMKMYLQAQLQILDHNIVDVFRMEEISIGNGDRKEALIADTRK